LETREDQNHLVSGVVQGTNWPNPNFLPTGIIYIHIGFGI